MCCNISFSFSDGPENVQITGPSEIEEKQTLTLTCTAESTPSASYIWTLNWTEIHNSSVFTKDITDSSDSGNYTCKAMNNITERTSSVVHGLTVKGKVQFFGDSRRKNENVPSLILYHTFIL